MGKITIRAKIKYSPFKGDEEYEYEGCKIKLIPDDKMEVIKLEAQNFEEGEDKGLEMINRVLSMMAYKRRAPLCLDRIIYVDFDPEIPGVRPTHRSCDTLTVIGEYPKLTQKDITTYSKNGDIKLRLALYREALNSESIYYKFLNFFRIIETFGAPKQWIVQNMDNLLDSDEKAKFLQRCKTKSKTAGKILYSDSRCAIVHANSKKKAKEAEKGKKIIIVDPDNPDDYREISMNLPIIKELAELAIEKFMDQRNKLK